MSRTQPTTLRTGSPAVCCSSSWEDAYARFETPEQEIRKFLRRLRALGAPSWPRSAAIVELFCGRGGGLHALSRLGFGCVEGVDLSASLLSQYTGAARCYVADCRELPFAEASKDVLITQGGLHHLETLPDDLEQVLAEAHRVLKRDGLFVIVEPWNTPFLRLVHRLCRSQFVRWGSPRFDALAIMIEHERTTYEQWLRQPRAILERLRASFEPVKQWTALGKLCFVGRKSPSK